MKLIAEITDKLLGLETVPIENVRKRYSARGILFDDQGRIAMMNVREKGFYKLPGGGMEQEDENAFEKNFIREIQEETGWTCTDIRPLGVALEIKTQESKLQLSFAFMGTRQAYVGTDLDAREEQRGITLEWMGLPQAIELLENQEKAGLEYTNKFIMERDLAILIEARKFLEGKV